MAKQRTEPSGLELTAAGPRVSLRPFREADIAAIEPWYGAAAAAVHGLPPDDAESIQNLYYQLEAAQAEPEGGLLAITPRDDETPIGLLDYRLNRPPAGWCTVGFIAVDPARRGYGLASEAVRAFEEAIRERGLGRAFCAGVQRDNGLGFYFWLRLGYRAATATEASNSRLADISWMIRAEQHQALAADRRR